MPNGTLAVVPECRITINYLIDKLTGIVQERFWNMYENDTHVRTNNAVEG